MLKNYPILFFILICARTLIFAQDSPALVYNFPSHNNLQFNRFLINPTFSITDKPNSYISLYHRNQWLQFDDAPKIYMASYSSSLDEKTGIAFGIYQQQEGVLGSWGGIANYSYKVSLSEKSKLLLGFNLAYYNTGINKANVISENPDPIVIDSRNNSLLSIKPGISLQLSNFNLGVYAENYIDYDFKNSELANNYNKKTLIGHVFYSFHNEKSGFFGNNTITLGTRIIHIEDRELSYNANILAEFPKLGWIQTSIEKFYGVSFGFGLHLTKRLSIGYTIEKGINNLLNAFGPTHEVVMTLSLQDRNVVAKNKTLVNLQNETLLDSLAKKTSETNLNITNEDPLILDQQKKEFVSKIENFKNEIKKEYWPLLDILAQSKDFDVEVLEEKLKNLSDYIKRVESSKENNDSNFLNKNSTLSPAEMDRAVKKQFKGKNKNLRETPKFGNRIEIEGMEKGIYVISNVFDKEENAINFISDLNKKGIWADYFINPYNNFRYVYLQHLTQWQDALKAYYSNLNNTYYGPIWLLQVNMNELN